MGRLLSAKGRSDASRGEPAPAAVRHGLLYALPTLLLIAAAVLPLALGATTLYSRDVLNTHYPLKWVQAAAMKSGTLPLVDAYRAGGQALVGNLNAVALYPDNLFYLLAHPLWALNAHFWLHWLLAPCCMFLLARAWGLGRPAAWAAGAVYGTSGYVLSQLNLYNLVAGTALAPAFVAAVLWAWRGPRWMAAVAGALWALLVLAGDPTLAALAALLAVSAALLRYRGLPARPALLALAAALVLGTLATAPLLVEWLRILPASYRGLHGYSERSAFTQSWDPRTLVEQLLPFFFGRLDFSFWGQRLHGGNPPLFITLYPGLLALALVLVAGRPRGAALRWAWAMVGGGLFFALGGFNPLLRGLYALAGGSLLRYPIKAWLLVAVGLALAAGCGFARLEEAGGGRRLGRALAFLAALYAGIWLLLAAAPGAVHALLRPVAPERLDGALFTAERLRWMGLCLLALVVLAMLAACAWLARRRRQWGGALLVAVHTAAQLFFLAPAYEQDVSAPYLTPPPLLDTVPPAARVVYGSTQGVFGTVDGNLVASFPDRRTLWLERHHFGTLAPPAGIAHGRRYELNPSAEGLDAYLTVGLTRGLRRLDDAARLRVLRASGVDRLLLERPLAPQAASMVRLLTHQPGPGRGLFVYEVVDTAAPVQLLGTVRYAPQPAAAQGMMTGPDFDPQREVVLTAAGEASTGPPGRVEVLAEDASSLDLTIDSPDGGALLIQRTFLPLYRATLDGAVVEIVPGNVHRMAIRVPAGRHGVRLWVDRKPFHLACGVALAALVGLAVLALAPGARRVMAG